MNNNIDYIVLVVIVVIAILYTAILLSYIYNNCKMNTSGGAEKKSKPSNIPSQITQVIKSLSKTGKLENLNDKIPHKDEYQKILESSIDSDLEKYNIDNTSFSSMMDYLNTNIRYKRRCLPVIIKNGKITFISPNPKAGNWGRDGVDNRVFTFIRMIKDLDTWCDMNDLILPECEFVIYVADTYAWEDVAKDLPWFIMAKPINRPGILIPDNSFISHGESGDIGSTNIGKSSKNGGINWMWDSMLKKSKSQQHTDKIDMLYFKGANTGTFKFSTRDYLSKYDWDIPVNINLNKQNESMFNWDKYSGLLNLPGNQPWSYRLKYLYLLKSPVVNVDVLLKYDKSDKSDDSLDRWIQFFDPLFIPNKVYIQVNQIYYDNPKLPDFNELRKESYEKIVDDIKLSYTKIDDVYAKRAYKKISNLSTSRILQFLYVTIVKYAISANK